MKKIDKAVEIVRGWSDEELSEFIVKNLCPDVDGFNLNRCVGYECDISNGDCKDGWNEEVEE